MNIRNAPTGYRNMNAIAAFGDFGGRCYGEYETWEKGGCDGLGSQCLEGGDSRTCDNVYGYPIGNLPSANNT